MTTYQAVFHIDESDKWPILIANVNNLLRDMDDEVETIILVNGKPVVDCKKDAGPAEDLEALLDRGVALEACLNALKANDVKEEDLLDRVTIIPAGVSRLIRLQDQGYAYIKP